MVSVAFSAIFKKANFFAWLASAVLLFCTTHNGIRIRISAQQYKSLYGHLEKPMVKKQIFQANFHNTFVALLKAVANFQRKNKRFWKKSRQFIMI